jgi:hypothetical protein
MDGILNKETIANNSNQNKDCPCAYRKQCEHAPESISNFSVEARPGSHMARTKHQNMPLYQCHTRQFHNPKCNRVF